MWWTEEACLDCAGLNLMASYSSRAELFLSTGRLPDISQNNSTEAKRFAPLSLLVTGDEAGSLVLSVNGIFSLIYMRIEGPAPVAVACCTSGDLQSLHTWVQTIDGPRLESYQLGFLSKKFEVVQTTTACTTISVLLKAATMAQLAASKAWSDALSPLDHKLELYASALRDWHSGSGPLPAVRDELLSLVTLSTTLVQNAKFR